MAYHGPMKARTALLLSILVLVTAVAIERLIVTDEERVEAAYAAIVAAVEAEQPGALAAGFAATLRFVGPAPVGSGDRDAARQRFAELFDQAHSIAIVRRGTAEITVAPGFATLRSPQLVRFKYGDIFVAYTLDAVLTFDRAGDGWLLSEVEITSLAPGLF